MAPVRWYGGKGNLLGFIRPLLAGIEADVYCEPYFGAGSLFFSLPRRPVEVINDLDQRLVNFYRVLQDPERCVALVHRLTFTLYSRAEFIRALDLRDDPDPVTAAWAMYTAQNQGFSGVAMSPGNWSRSVSDPNQRRWRSRLALLQEWHDRLQHAAIDCRCALDVIRSWDSPETLFYLDPPYLQSTRSQSPSGRYVRDGDDAHHKDLLALLPQLEGFVVLSGYSSDAYEQGLSGWRKVERRTVCHAAGRVRGSGLKGNGAAKAKMPRTEVLWLNHAAAAACKAAPGIL
jgi:DNA adenine methylase